MSAKDPQVRIRLPQSVKDWVENEAAMNRRTINAQVVYALERQMRGDLSPSVGKEKYSN
jgi:hypothetical protein